MAARDEKVLFELMNSKGDKPGKTLKLGGRQYRYQNSKVPPGQYKLSLGNADVRAVFVDVDVISVQNQQILRKKVTLRMDDVNKKFLEFEIKAEQAPASIVLNYKILFLGLVGIKVFTKIVYQPYDLYVEKQAGEIQRDVTLSILSNKSSWHEEAKQKGFIRPFLLLASMHPSARREIGRALDVKIKHIGDPHREASVLLFTDRKGIAARISGMFEKAVGADFNWFDVLVRTSEEGFRGDSKLDKMSLSQKDQVEGCRNPAFTALSTIENTFLEQLAALHLKKLPKDARQAVEQLYEQQKSSELFQTLNKHGMQSDDIKKFALTFFNTDTEGMTTDDFVANLQGQLFGAKDTTMNNTKKALKAGKTFGMVGAHLILLELVPVIGVAFTAAMIAHHLFGATTDIAIIAVINILLQKMLLAAQDISIHNFY